MPQCETSNYRWRGVFPHKRGVRVTTCRHDGTVEVRDIGPEELSESGRCYPLYPGECQR